MPYLFAYGSLINCQSASRALKRQVSPREMLPCRVRGYQKAWNNVQQVWAESVAKEVTAVFLNLEERPGAVSLGVLLEISDDELDALVQREKGYSLIQVSVDRLHAGTAPLQALTFIDEHPIALHAGEPALAGVVFLDAYLAKVREGCAEIGVEFLSEFDATTDLPDLQRIAGNYRFVDPVQRQLT